MKKIHFIGIGGIGVSGLARYMKEQGYEITGSDLVQTKITQALKQDGIIVNTPHNAKNITNQDLVVHTSIASSDNVEIKEALKKGIKVLSRKDFLPIMLENKQVHSVCGAHGKSTTTAILSEIYSNSSAIIGAESKAFKSNMRFGKDKRFKRTFNDSK